MADDNGWVEHGKLILKELERLNTNYESLRTNVDLKFTEVKEEISTIKNVEEKLSKIDGWKSRIDDIISPTQLKEMKDEVVAQKNKWIFMYAAIAVIQVISGIIVFFLTYFK